MQAVLGIGTVVLSPVVTRRPRWAEQCHLSLASPALSGNQCQPLGTWLPPEGSLLAARGHREALGDSVSSAGKRKQEEGEETEEEWGHGRDRTPPRDLSPRADAMLGGETPAVLPHSVLFLARGHRERKPFLLRQDHPPGCILREQKGSGGPDEGSESGHSLTSRRCQFCSTAEETKAQRGSLTCRAETYSWGSAPSPGESSRRAFLRAHW